MSRCFVSRRPCQRLQDQHGSVMVLSAIAVVVAMGAAALSVDIGAMAAQKREVRKIADLAALDATTNLSRIISDPLTLSKTAAVQDVVEKSAARNGLVLDSTDPRTSLNVVLGKYVAGSFTVCSDLEIPLLCMPNSVRVTATDVAPRYFAFFAEEGVVNAVATAARASGRTTSGGPGTPGTPGTQDNVATISAGSFVARAEFDTDPVIGNPLLPRVLRGLLGNSAGVVSSFDAISYKGLATQEVTLEALRQSLEANGVASVGTVDEMLDAEMELDTFYDAVADAVVLSGGNSAVAADLQDLATLAAASTTTGTFRFGDFFDVEAGQPDTTGAAQVNVLDLVTSAAQVANGDNLIDIDLAGALPGEIANADLSATIIEPPVIATGPVGTRVQTSQVRFQLNLVLDEEARASSILGLLSSDVRLPLVVEAGNATAEITNIFNPPLPSQQQVDVATKTSAAYVGIGELPLVEDLRNSLPPTLPQVDLLLDGVLTSVTSPKSSAVAECEDDIAFLSPFDPANAFYTQTVGCDVLDLPATLTDPVTQVLGGGLLNSLLSALLGDVNDIINDALGPIEQLVDQLTAGFGITVGGADVTVHDVEATTVTGSPAVPGVPGPTTTAEDFAVLVK